MKTLGVFPFRNGYVLKKRNFLGFWCHINMVPKEIQELMGFMLCPFRVGIFKSKKQAIHFSKKKWKTAVKYEGIGWGYVKRIGNNKNG